MTGDLIHFELVFKTVLLSFDTLQFYVLLVQPWIISKIDVSSDEFLLLLLQQISIG